MSKIIAVWIMVLGIVGFALADVITTFDTPQNLSNPATKMQQMSIKLIPSQNRVIAEVYWIDSGGNTITTKVCDFVDPAVTNATIGAGKVGQKYIDVMMQFTQNKCKQIWSVTGTDITQ